MRNKWSILVVVLTAVVVLVCLFTAESPQEIGQALAAADRSYLGMALAAMGAFWILESLLLRQVARGMGHRIGLWDSVRVSMAGQLFNHLTPSASGGQPVQAFLLTRHGIPFGEGSCVLMVKFILYQLAMTLYSVVVVALRHRAFSPQVPGFWAIVLMGLFTNILAVSVFVGVGLFPRLTTRVVRWGIGLLARLRLLRHPEHTYAWAEEQLEGFYENFLRMRGHWHVMLWPLVVTLVQLTVYFSIPYLVLRALGLEAQFFELLCATACVYMFTAFIPAPGASGGAEGASYLFLGMFVPDRSLLLIAIVLWRVITYYLPILVCVPFYLGRKKQ